MDEINKGESGGLNDLTKFTLKRLVEADYITGYVESGGKIARVHWTGRGRMMSCLVRLFALDMGGTAQLNHAQAWALLAACEIQGAELEDG